MDAKQMRERERAAKQAAEAKAARARDNALCDCIDRDDVERLAALVGVRGAERFSSREKARLLSRAAAFGPNSRCFEYLLGLGLAIDGSDSECPLAAASLRAVDLGTIPDPWCEKLVGMGASLEAALGGLDLRWYHYHVDGMVDERERRLRAADYLLTFLDRDSIRLWAERVLRCDIEGEGSPFASGRVAAWLVSKGAHFRDSWRIHRLAWLLGGDPESLAAMETMNIDWATVDEKAGSIVHQLVREIVEECKRRVEPRLLDLYVRKVPLKSVLACDQDGFSAFRLAVAGGHLPLAAWMRSTYGQIAPEGFDVNFVYRNGRTPLECSIVDYVARSGERVDFANWLIDSGADLEWRIEAEGCTVRKFIMSRRGESRGLAEIAEHIDGREADA